MDGQIIPPLALINWIANNELKKIAQGDSIIMSRIVVNLRIYIFNEEDKNPVPIMHNIESDGELPSLLRELTKLSREVQAEGKKSGKPTNFRIAYHTRQFGNYEVTGNPDGTMSEIKEVW
jgi:hypothetical protein